MITEQKQKKKDILYYLIIIVLVLIIGITFLAFNNYFLKKETEELARRIPAEGKARSIRGLDAVYGGEFVINKRIKTLKKNVLETKEYIVGNENLFRL